LKKYFYNKQNLKLMDMDTIISKLKSQFFLFFTLALLFAGCDKNDPFDANSGTFTDKRDGHMYKWVKIGEQIWMAENLAYVPYACAPDSQCGIWVYDYYGEGSFYENYTTYGCLYDWETAQTACPEGWHLPSDEEWMELERFLGMEEDELKDETDRGVDENIAGKLKSTDSSFWGENVKTNESGFSAIPGGRRDIWHTTGDYHFRSIGNSAVFWTRTEDDYITHAINRNIVDLSIERESRSKNAGFSIRCIRN
jgi:uncharacterized protein (TIGR02145 family)